MKLKDILAKGSEAIAAASFILGQKLDTLDCAEVETIVAEELALLLSKIPSEWELVELAKVFQEDTLTESFMSTPSVFAPHTLDIFSLRNEVVADYRHYIESFLKIRDSQVKQFVHQELERGHLWTDPLMQLNPFYKQGSGITELVQHSLLYPNCAQYFVTDKSEPYQFRYHQEQAFLAAQRQEPYVLTTGTGSGKSMTYVVPIFDDLLRHPEVKGVRAILVYPMNALINSQKQEFDKFLAKVPGTSIRVEQYTGQESLQKKTEIQNHPPHILLTNYVMLELMLTRTYEAKLVTGPDLKFLVLDELHTYRGRQGADVALLIRKLRQRSGKDLLCIGTSATMSTEGNRDDRRRTVAGVASKLFGVQVS